jgi:hypothetical protein
MSDFQRCGRQVIEGAPEYGLCLMHSQDPKKPISEFTDEVGAILRGVSRHHRPQDRYDFRGFVFPSLAVFIEKEFAKLAEFGWAKFPNDAYFTSAVFLRDVTFSQAEFSGKATFYGCRF